MDVDQVQDLQTTYRRPIWHSSPGTTNRRPIVRCCQVLIGSYSAVAHPSVEVGRPNDWTTDGWLRSSGMLMDPSDPRPDSYRAGHRPRVPTHNSTSSQLVIKAAYLPVTYSTLWNFTRHTAGLLIQTRRQAPPTQRPSGATPRSDHRSDLRPNQMRPPSNCDPLTFPLTTTPNNNPLFATPFDHDPAPTTAFSRL